MKEQHDIGILESVKRYLPRKGMARNVSILMGGTAAGQGMMLIAAPLLTRLYSPEDFGLLAVFTALMSITGIIVTLRYHMAIPLPKDEKEAAHIVVLSMLVVLCMTFLSSLIVHFFKIPITRMFNLPDLADYLWLLPMGVLLLGMYDVFNYWAIRAKSFPAIARTRIAKSFGTLAVQLGGFGLGPLALLLGQIVGLALGSASLAAMSIRNNRAVFRMVQLKGIRIAANRYRRFPLYSTWGGIFNTVGLQLPPLMFAALFNPAVAGLYALAHRALAMPMSLVGTSIADVFFSEAATARRDGKLSELVDQIHKKLVQIAMPPTLLLLVVAPDLFHMIFGDAWRQAGEVARWLAPMLYIQFIISPLSRIFIVLERQAQGTILQAVLLFSRITAVAIGAWLGDFLMAVIIYGAASAMCYLLYLIFIVLICKQHWTAIWLPSLRIFPIAIILTSPSILIFFFQGGPLFIVSGFLACAVSISIFYIYIFRHNNSDLPGMG